MAVIYREIHMGCAERQDGSWNMIVIPRVARVTMSA
jgi:hypothetical protein